MRLFTPAIERTLAAMAVSSLLMAILLPAAWGYEQRQQARAWQETACRYRLRELARETNQLISDTWRRDACRTVRDLGLDLDAASPPIQ